MDNDERVGREPTGGRAGPARGPEASPAGARRPRARGWEALGPARWPLLAALVVTGDFLAGPQVQFPILYILPVGLAAWHDGRNWAIGLAVALPMVRLAFHLFLWEVVALPVALLNMSIRVSVLTLLALLVSRTADQTHELGRRVQALEGILPLCSHCKRIRNDANEWERIEKYIGARSRAQFSHGICPECLHRHYPGAVEADTQFS